jgi:hypothetical protein
MNRRAPLVIGSIISFIFVLIFVWLVVAGRAGIASSVTSDVLDIQLFRKNLSIIDQKEKNGDLPVNLSQEGLGRDDPFGGL